MAKITVEITSKKITKTLSFMGLDFTEVWESYENYWRSRTLIREEVKAALPDLGYYIHKIIENFSLDALDEDEMAEALETLTDYEKGIKP